MSKSKYIVLKEKEKSGKLMTIVFGFVVLLAVVIPFFMLGLRYQIGNAISTVLNTIGKFLLFGGAIYMMLGVVGIFTKSHNWTSKVIIGVILLWVGCWCTGSVVNFFGLIIGGSNPSGGGGYH